jgi:hypothetical protein
MSDRCNAGLVAMLLLIGGATNLVMFINPVGFLQAAALLVAVVCIGGAFIVAMEGRR